MQTHRVGTIVRLLLDGQNAGGHVVLLVSRLFSLLCGLILSFAALPCAAANPTVPQGASNSFPVTGTHKPGTGLT